MKVLVTDAELTLTLAAIRSLAAAGADVVGVATTASAHGFRSRFVCERVISPSPADPQRFVAFVAETVDRFSVDVVLPVGQESTVALAHYRDRLPAGVGIPVAAWRAVQVAISKRRTADLATEIGIRVPARYDGPTGASFPAVAKRAVGSGQVRYASSPADLAGLDESWVVQEYVPGEGRGLFALFDHGEPCAVFMHRRLRELPVTGGASTAAESIDDPRLRELGLRLLRALGWHGLAMVEFKLDRRDGEYTLMEINPKLWGSLDLAIAAGVDFPRLAVDLAAGRAFDAPRYRSGLRYQWVVRDLVRAVARPRDLPAVLRDLADVRVANDIVLRDPLPTLAEASATVRAAVGHARAGTFRYPHGRPARPPV